MISLIIPCKNEFGTIYDAISLGIKLPGVSEIIVTVGTSKDNTYDEAKRAENEIGVTSKINIQVQKQKGTGKWGAVKESIELANNKYVSIWDADLTVSFSEQSLIHERFLSSLKHMGTDCLAIGDRMTFREPGSMRIANYFGNKLFALIWSVLSRQKINDTLCGSKVFSIEILDSVSESLKSKDPYGDVTIITGALLAKRKIEVQIVSYRARTYGQTNILRWSGAIQLLRFTISAAGYLKLKNK
jgi:glycosyltransferase involved in cell wall biosynthesis